MTNIRLTGHQRKALASQIKADIDTFCQSRFNEARREHLGASEIGKTCMRRLVYAWRWMHREQFDGRMLRLFNRGHMEEHRLIEWLQGIEAQVMALTADGKQIKIPTTHGHFKGSLDSVIRLPQRYGILPDFLGEYKTHNEKSFTKLVKEGVKISKPEHYKQMCVYGEAMGFQYAIYLAVNKNDDDIYVEVIELDWTLGKSLRNEVAGSVINAGSLPNKIAATAAFFECKFCPMAGICHNDQPVDINCRSCNAAIANPDGSWACANWNMIIPPDKIPLGCSDWSEFK